MLSKAIIISLSLAISTTAAALRLQSNLRKYDDEDDCPKGAYIIGVRGTTEEYPYGALQKVVDKLMEKIPDSENEGVDYPAAGIVIREGQDPIYNIFEYQRSIIQGYNKLSGMILDFAAFCPKTSIVLMGYSQVG